MKYRPPHVPRGRRDATRWRSWDVAREQGRRTGSPGTLQGGRAATGTRAAGAGWLAVGWPSASLMGGRAALARAGSAAMAMRGRRLRGRVGQNASRCIEEMGMVTLEEREEQCIEEEDRGDDDHGRLCGRGRASVWRAVSGDATPTRIRRRRRERQWRILIAGPCAVRADDAGDFHGHGRFHDYAGWLPSPIATHFWGRR